MGSLEQMRDNLSAVVLAKHVADGMHTKCWSYNGGEEELGELRCFVFPDKTEAEVRTDPFYSHIPDAIWFNHTRL